MINIYGHHMETKRVLTVFFENAGLSPVANERNRGGELNNANPSPTTATDCYGFKLISRCYK